MFNVNTELMLMLISEFAIKICSKWFRFRSDFSIVLRVDLAHSQSKKYMFQLYILLVSEKKKFFHKKFVMMVGIVEF
jgi:hypothetical protein